MVVRAAPRPPSPPNQTTRPKRRSSSVPKWNPQEHSEMSSPSRPNPKRRKPPPLPSPETAPSVVPLTELERYTQRFKSNLEIDGDRITTHLTTLQQRASRTGKNPTISEVLLKETPIGDAASKSSSLLQPSPLVTDTHPFGPTLKEWQNGVAVDCGPNWSLENILLAIDKGPHRSALSPEAIDLFAQDISYQVKAGFSDIVSLEDLLAMNIPNLKISPVAVVLQPGRRGRIILDLSFPVRRSIGRKMGPVLQKAVNATTSQTAPRVPVKIIGKVLDELVEYMVEAPSETNILFSKLDLSDGFWRMIVRAADRYNFCYVLPQPPGSPVKIVVPSALQMGWQESPGYFCAATETGRDFIDHLMEHQPTLPPHPLENYIINNVRHLQPQAEPSQTVVRPWKISVYVDDYIGAILSYKGIRFFRRFARAALYGIHAIFPPPEVTGHTNGKNSVSIKKCERGDTMLAAIKEILGFVADGITRTWLLPSEKTLPMIKEIRLITKKQRVLRHRLQKIVGKLVNATRIAPAAKALLTPCFLAMKQQPTSSHIPLRAFDLRNTLTDLATLLADLHRRPTHVNEMVKFDPSSVGMLDGSTSEGIGGVWFSPMFRPTVWRLLFPPDVRQLAKSGALTINDIELAAIVTQQLVLETLCTTRHRSSHLFCDSSTATSWASRLIAKSSTVIAGRLLRVMAIRHRQMEAPFPTVTHWAGRLLANADTAAVDHFTTDLASAWRSIDHATVDVAARLSAWHRWCKYIDQHQLGPPYLQPLSPQERLHILLAFAAHTRSGALGKGRQVQTGSVTTTLRYIGQTFDLAGFSDPRMATDTSRLHIAVTRLYRSYRNEDPPPRSQIALPVSVFQNIQHHEGQSHDLHNQATSDLIITAFFFLLRVGEYTQPSKNKNTRTVQFRLRDITFWHNTTALPFDSPLAVLQTATKVTLRIDNQKNCHRDDTLTHDSVPGPMDPVKVLARRFVAARTVSSHNPDALLSQYGPSTHVTASHITTVLRRAVLRSGATRSGFDLDRTGTHSIRASGAMALFLNDVEPLLIRKMGRWRSETWLTYIHNQIGELTAGLSRRMSRPILFHNVAVRTAR